MTFIYDIIKFFFTLLLLFKKDLELKFVHFFIVYFLFFLTMTEIYLSSPSIIETNMIFLTIYLKIKMTLAVNAAAIVKIQYAKCLLIE